MLPLIARGFEALAPHAGRFRPFMRVGSHPMKIRRLSCRRLQSPSPSPRRIAAVARHRRP